MTAAAMTGAAPPKGSGSSGGGSSGGGSSGSGSGSSKKAPNSVSSSPEEEEGRGGPSYEPIATALAAAVTRGGAANLDLLRQALAQHPEAVNGLDEKDQTPAIYGGCYQSPYTVC
jgi:hypothetical protein